MRIFAWILWAIMLVAFVAQIILFSIGVDKLRKGADGKIEISLTSVALNAAVFVFINLYLFN
jgi:hypothetical protein